MQYSKCSISCLLDQIILNQVVTTLLDGLVSCYNAFGSTVNTGGCPTQECNTDDANGYLAYTGPFGASVDEALDDLVLLLTRGRLSSTNRGIVRGAIEQEYNNGDKAKATCVAQ